MAIIGKFTKDGAGFTGNIETLTLKEEVAFEPIERKSSERSPDFRSSRKSPASRSARLGKRPRARRERTTFPSSSTIQASWLPSSADFSRAALSWATASCGIAGVNRQSGRRKPPLFLQPLIS
jgi:hypothetical protein